MDLDLFQSQKSLRAHGVLITFSGRFSQEIIEELGDAVTRYLETEMTSHTHTYNVFAVFIEQTQNIRNYSTRERNPAIREQISNSGIVAIGKADTGYFVSSGNLIENKDVDALVAKLEKLVTADKTELKKIYKEQMKKDVSPESNSAGIGLIDIARRASRPLEYAVKPVAEGISFFTLNVYI